MSGGPVEEPSPGEALADAGTVRLQSIWDRYGVRGVRVFGSVARGDDRPGSDLDLLCHAPDGFSVFTMEDLRSDLEALLGCRVDLISDHPVNQGSTMDAIRAAAVPLAEVINRVRDSDQGQPAHPGNQAITDDEIDAAIQALDLPGEAAATGTWLSEWHPERGVVQYRLFDPEADNVIEQLAEAIRECRDQGFMVEMRTFPRSTT